jgi:uncharacterized protein (TIGR03000 family)
MFKRWRSASLLAFLAGSFFLCPQTARAQFIYGYGGGSLFGRPTYLSPYTGPANRNLWNPYGYGTFGGYGTYGPYGWYGSSPYPGYAPGGYLNFATGPNPYGWSGYAPPTTYTPGLSTYNPGLVAPITPGTGDAALASPYRARDQLVPSAQVPRMRPTLAPALAISPGEATARVEVIVPSADAAVWFQGVKTSQTGTIREFVSPPLARGSSYSYTVRARWRSADGAPVTQTRTVPVRPGQRVRVDFSVPEE